MAGADYRNCDVCGCKAFYDAELNYGNYDRTDADGYLLPMHNTGAWRVLCLDCAETHTITISPKLPPSPAPMEGRSNGE